LGDAWAERIESATDYTINLVIFMPFWPSKGEILEFSGRSYMYARPLGDVRPLALIDKGGRISLHSTFLPVCQYLFPLFPVPFPFISTYLSLKTLNKKVMPPLFREKSLNLRSNRFKKKI